MPVYEAPKDYRGFGFLLVVLGFLSIGFAAMSAFGDRMPNPPPEIKKEFEAVDRRIHYLILGGGAAVIVGLVLTASSSSSLQNQRRD